MDNFERMENQGSYSERITEIASRLAINKYNANKGKNVDLNSEIKDNVASVNNKINAIRIEIEKKIPGLDLPKDLDDTIAEYLIGAIDSGITEISQLAIEEGLSTEIFKGNVLPNKDKEEVLEAMKKNEASGIGMRISEGEIVALYEQKKYKIPETLKELMPELNEEEYNEYENRMNIRFPNRNFTLNDFETSSEGVKEFCDPIKDVLDKKFENVQANDSMEQNELGENNFNDVMDLLIIQNAATVYGENLVYGQVPEENRYEYLGKILILKEFGSEDTKELLENMVKILPEEIVYSTDENGKKSIDFEKIREEYKRVNNGRDFDSEFAFSLFRDMAIEMSKNPENLCRDTKDLMEESIIDGQRRMLSKKYTNLEEILKDPKTSPKDVQIAITEFRAIAAEFPDAALRLAEGVAENQMEQGTLNEQAFSVLANATLDSLIKAEEGNNFVDDEYTKASKEKLFKKIIDKGINGKEPIDQELLSKMVRTDSQIMSNILLELIGKQNENLSSNLVLGIYIQEIGQTVKSISDEKSEPTISANKVEIGQIVEQFADKSDGIFKGENIDKNEIKKEDANIRSDDDEGR